LKHSETFPAILATQPGEFPVLSRKTLDTGQFGVVTVSGNFR